MKKLSISLFAVLAIVFAVSSAFTTKNAKPFADTFKIMTIQTDVVDASSYTYSDVTSSIQDLLKTATSPFSNVANGTDQQQLDWFINNTSSGLSFPSHSPAYVRLTCSADADQLCSAYTVTDGAGGSYSADEVLAVRTGDFAYSTF